MNKKTLLILGDSTSMTVGCEQAMYPFLLADEPIWESGTRFVNCSLPGMTSADATAFFRDFVSLNGYPDAVIVYLGNCDGISTELVKGRFTPSKETKIKLAAMLGREPKRQKLKNRLLHFEWNGDFDASIESPENPHDFEYNLSRIISACRAHRVPLLLVRPKANRHYLPGLGKGNFLFYRFFGQRERIALRLGVSDARFVDALRAQESGDLAAARLLYKRILQDSGPLSTHPEFPLIVVNNYAVACAEDGLFEEAKALFRALLKERAIRSEIVWYNLAHTLKASGNTEESHAAFMHSYENDSSLYRVRAPYIEAIDRLVSRFASSVAVIDMDRLIGDDRFVDHCHPDGTGQERLAERILSILHKREWIGDARAVIVNDLRNPELAFGNKTEMFTYFRTFSNADEKQIASARENLLRELPDQPIDTMVHPALQSIDKSFSAAIEFALRHPAFPSVQDYLRFGPVRPIDVGRFPEFFVYRHVIPYLREIESDSRLANLFNRDLNLLRPSESLSRLSPKSEFEAIHKAEISFDPARDRGLRDRIITKVRRQLTVHLEKGNQISERAKTLMYWYFREVLRFGAHSRVSMRYDRVTIEFAAEGLAVASVLDRELGGEREPEILRLIGSLEETVRIHEQYCALVSPGVGLGGWIAEYDSALADLARRLTPEESSTVCIS